MLKEPKKWTAKLAEQAMEEFNRLYPVGTRVLLQKDVEQVETTVSSEPWTVGSYTPIARFKGISGGYLITRVLRKIEDVPA